MWSLIMFFTIAGFSVIMYGGYSFARHGDDSPGYFIGGCFLILVGVFLFSRIQQKKYGNKSLS